MKSKRISFKRELKYLYPQLKIYCGKDTKFKSLIILFTALNIGTVVYKGTSPFLVGYTTGSWSEIDFISTTDTIELSND